MGTVNQRAKLPKYLRETASQKEVEQRRMQELEFTAMCTHMQDKYGVCMSVEDAASELKISRDLVYDLINRDEFPSKKLGRRTVVPTVQLVSYLLKM